MTWALVALGSAWRAFVRRHMGISLMCLLALALSACAGGAVDTGHTDQIPAACAEINIVDGPGSCRVAPGVVCYFDAAGMPSDSKDDRAFTCEAGTLRPVLSCTTSNTAPGCGVSPTAWAVTCGTATPAPAAWCSMPDGDTSGRVWCC